MPRGRIGAAVKAIADSVAKGMEDASAATRSLVEKSADSVEKTLEDHRVNDAGVRDRLHAAAGRKSDFFSKSPTRTNRDVLDNGPGTPMSLDNVNEVAGRMGINLGDVDVVIIKDPEEIRYLDHMDAGAYTPSELNGTQIRLGPASFADDETLAATIAHEHTHVQQQLAGQHLERPLKDLEDEAYASEIPALERYRNGPP
jgi:hypothetical protein